MLKIYDTFMQLFPDPKAIISASEEEIKRIIRPLGIEHQRAKLLKKLAETIVSKFRGDIPCSKAKLKELPGVGDYIASEVLLGACNSPEPFLHSNMIRIIESIWD